MLQVILWYLAYQSVLGISEKNRYAKTSKPKNQSGIKISEYSNKAMQK